jgi:hypothetical protein
MSPPLRRIMPLIIKYLASSDAYFEKKLILAN